MVYAEILAGGIGTRMNDTNSLPKQYLSINNKPVIIYTIEKFLHNKYVDKIIIGCQDNWKQLLKQLIEQYIDKTLTNNIYIYSSGKDRNTTMINGCLFIKKFFNVYDDDIIITIDATRMLVSDEIITNNILSAQNHSAVVTLFPVVDTIALSHNYEYLDDIPERASLYSLQAPETFNLKKLIKYYYNVSDEEKATLTCVSKLFLLNGEKVFIVNGNYNNIKITYKNDLNIIKNMLDN